MEPLSIAILLVVLASAAVAIRFGGGPERTAATVIVAWIVADAIHHLISGPATFENVDPVHLVLDTGELVAIVWIALRANRMWPLWAAAAQLICVSGHVAALIEPSGMRRAYWAITQLPQYIQLAALLLGTAAHVRRERDIGPYRNWREA